MAFFGAEPNAFDPTQPNLAPEQVQLEQVIAKAVRLGALNLRVALPCRIEAVTSDQCVNLQPLLQTYFRTSGPQDMAQLHDVPVVMPHGADYRIGLPLAVGDLGLAVFCDRNIDAYIASDGTKTQDPQDDRCHTLSDAVFFPGFLPQPKRTQDVQASQDLVLENGALSVRLQKSGSISFKNAQSELVHVIDQLVQANISLADDLAQAMVLSSFGPAPFLQSSIAAFKSISQTLAGIRDNLKTFIPRG